MSVSDRCRDIGGAAFWPAVVAEVLLKELLVGDRGRASSAKGEITREEGETTPDWTTWGNGKEDRIDVCADGVSIAGGLPACASRTSFEFQLATILEHSTSTYEGIPPIDLKNSVPARRRPVQKTTHL